MRLVYGGGTNGLMGEVARALVALSGPDAVHGIIPEPLLPEKSGKSVIDESVYGKTTVVKSMHEKKKAMWLEVLRGGHGGGFVALSGGYGTFEELMEVATWNQLGKHSMPIVLLNVSGYWDGLLNWTANAVREKSVRPGNSNIIVAATTAEGIFDLLKTYKPATSRFRLSWERL
ncbi:hypothetical protein N0V87_010701 [Didymella glomerata]|uniref:Cytokinin riboside 5'-monophosphate phosphoribohydrolase n=1 Tax=Didymella glomerata TaxID=749621 RepID=A0A9W8WNW7_9PLEO|nr:hypothetical protein N0V87_010701 [Didymella glomerata]